MIKTVLLFGMLLTGSILYAQPANKIHANAILVDTHNDILSAGILDGLDISKRLTQGHSDLVRWKEGGLDAQFFSVYTGEKARNKEKES